MSSPILLIVNSDDFGLAEGVNQAVATAFERGILRSASLLAGGAFAAEAAQIASERPGLGVGVHLALTQIRPVLPPEKLPGLTDGRDTLPIGPGELVKLLVAGKLDRSEIVAEFAAQVEKALDLGVKITHLDGHQHLHLLPTVREAFADTARRFDIRRLRLPRLGGPLRSTGEWIKAAAVAAAAQTAKPSFRGMVHPQYFWGLACSGEMTRSRLQSILQKLQPGTHEIMMHPAQHDVAMHRTYHWDYHWEDEFAALCDADVAKEIERRNIRLINYGDLPAGDR